MKKLIKIFIVIVMLFSVYLIHPNAATDNSKGGKTTTTTTTTQSNNNGPEKGDLRCPVNVSGCKETKDRSGKVIETVVTSKQDGVTVIKYVRKTDTPGEVEVQFKMSGIGSVTASSKAYVVLVMDASSTMSAYYSSKVIPAAKSFAKIVNQTNSNNIYLAFVSYNNKVSASRAFSNDNFDNASFGGTASGSQIHYGFAKANEFFSNVTGRKYVVIFSDGKFRSREDDPFGTDWQTLRDTTDVRYSIDFVPPGGGSKSEYRNNLRAFVKDPGKYYYLKTDYNYNAIFEEVAIDIHEDIEETCISGSVVDTLGSKFSLIEKSGRKVFLEFNNVTSDGVLSNPFKIKIDRTVKNGWYPTNSNYKFNVGGGKNYTVKINPEIYWERESKELLSCSDKQQFSESDSKNEQYYSIKCYQGWGKKVGYSAELKINGEDLNTKKIFLNRGEGFSANLKLLSHLKCEYEFDYKAFNNRIQEINNLLNDSNITKKEKQALRKELDGTDGKGGMLGTGGVLDTYIELTTNRSKLKSEKERFEKQTAVLKVSYLNSNNYDKVNLENVKLGENKIECEENNKQTINGKKIFVQCVCNVTLSKTMSLPTTCLSMETGEQEECLTNSNNQISGSNLFYPRLDSTGGYISLNIENAGYFRNNITLDGDETDNNVRRCEFGLTEEILSSSNSMYRQIELSDPFLKTYTKKRITGRNWNNKKYNFEEVIDKNTWNDTYQFKYVISKSNVNNIIKDTISSNERVNSYLGSDCYFTKNNKYVCSLTRNKASDGVTWFSKVYIND